MEITPLEIEGVYLGCSPLHIDERGYFREWFRQDAMSGVNHGNFEIAQANVSVSNRNVLRGIHYSISDFGQEKWVTCTRGSILDFIIDLRVNSKTYKEWISVDLNETNGSSILIGNGLGHAFVALEDNTQVTYLLTSKYQPDFERTIFPFDLELDIKWGSKDLILSERDKSAPTLSHARDNGYLPK